MDPENSVLESIHAEEIEPLVPCEHITTQMPIKREEVLDDGTPSLASNSTAILPHPAFAGVAERKPKVVPL